jgi:hypothetical protein
VLPVFRTVTALRPVGSTSSSRTFEGECERGGAFRHAAHVERRQGCAYRNDTETTAPLWDGPRLRPAFVAQVLGQVLMDAQSQALSLAPAAYRQRNAQIAHGLLLDDGI